MYDGLLTINLPYHNRVPQPSRELANEIGGFDRSLLGRNRKKGKGVKEIQGMASNSNARDYPRSLSSFYPILPQSTSRFIDSFELFPTRSCFPCSHPELSHFFPSPNPPPPPSSRAIHSIYHSEMSSCLKHSFQPPIHIINLTPPLGSN
jgi:hypothetical protein